MNGSSFLEFFAALQRRQEAAAAGADPSAAAAAAGGGPSSAALAAAAAAAPRPFALPADETADSPARSSAPVAGGAAPAPAGAPPPPRLPELVDWDAVRGARLQLGRQLTALRAEQDQLPLARREAYSEEHVARLEMFRPAAPYRRPRANRLCAKAHPQPCPYGCRTCHFCRQRTTEVKTACRLCEGVNNFYGGPQRGSWCGSCLWLRVGENVDEVRGRPDWACPACRDVCNCSGANCMRLKRGWFPTAQLAHEAREQGFRSVAHYLVLTHVSAAAAAAPIADNSHIARAGAPQRGGPDGGGADARGGKRQRTLEFGAATGRARALEVACGARQAAELAAVLGELAGGTGGGAGAADGAGGRALQRLLDAAGGGGAGADAVFLGILDLDLAGDGDEDEPAAAAAVTTGASAPGAAGEASLLRSAAGEGGGGAPLEGGGHAPAQRERAAAAPGAARLAASAASYGAPSAALDLLPPRRPPVRGRGGGAVGEPGAACALEAAAARGDDALRRMLPLDLNSDGHTGLPGGCAPAAPMAAPARPRVMRALPAPSLDAAGFEAPRASARRHEGGAVPAPRSRAEGGGALRGPADGPTTSQEAAAALCEEAMEVEAEAQDAQEQAGAAPAPEAMLEAQQLQPALEVALDLTAAGAATAAPLEEIVDCGAAARAAAAQAPDEFVWALLHRRAAAALHAVRALDRHHPETPGFVGPLAGLAADAAAYEAAYDALQPTLRAVLRDAEALLPAPAVVPAPKGDGDADGGDSGAPAGLLRSHAGLRASVGLLGFLACLLPADDVRWRVERRLLLEEPLLDFGRSDARARAIALRAQFELAATLAARGLAVGGAAAGAARALARVAADMGAALPLLNAMVAGEAPPPGDVAVGAWAYDAAARARPGLEVFSELAGLYGALAAVLTAGLGSAAALCRAGAAGLGTAGAELLAPELADALLAPGRPLPAAPRRAGLALVVATLDVASPAADGLELSADARAARAAARDALCARLAASVVPALEALVQQDYPLWCDPGAAASASRSGAAASASAVCSGGGEAGGGEKVEALARAYAFLLECGRAGWAEVEARAAQPFPPALFWRQANAPYRRFAVFLLAHVLRHAPTALDAPAAAASAARAWLAALLDTGRRRSAAYLTRALAAAPGTAALFAGVPRAQLEAVAGDAGGTARAALAGAVARRAAADPAWRGRLGALLVELDEVLAARRREVEATAFEPAAAVRRWEAAASKLVLALLDGAAPALAEAARHGGPADPAARALAALLARCAGWAVAAAADLHRRAAAAREASGESAPADAYDEDAAAPLTAAAARKLLAEGPFAPAALRQLWAVLGALGAPAALAANERLMRPLWAVVAGGVEVCSGEARPTAADEATLGALAESLAPAAPPAEEGEGAAPAPPAPQPTLALYVLATFVRRYLQRSSLRHAAHERAAVNALRLAGALLARPGLRAGAPRDAALGALLRPALGVLRPERGAPPSAGAKHALFELLANLLRAQPDLLPPLTPAPDPAERGGTPSALHAFWLGACRDALACVAAVLPAEGAPRALALASAAAARGDAAAPPPLQPATEATVAEAANNLLGTLRRLPAVDAVERAYARAGGAAPIPPPVAAGGGGAPAAAVAMPPPPALSQPGDFPWELARGALAFVRALAALPPPAPGAAWAMACFPAAHFLVLGAGAAGRLLQPAYLELRAGVEAATGPLAGYGLRSRPAAAAAAPAPGAPAALASQATQAAAPAAGVDVAASARLLAAAKARLVAAGHPGAAVMAALKGATEAHRVGGAWRAFSVERLVEVALEHLGGGAS
jgi:hypothetical protein